jgi:signal transduction histidine kinase
MPDLGTDLLVLVAVVILVWIGWRLPRPTDAPHSPPAHVAVHAQADSAHTGTVAHEINNLLTVITVYGGMVLSELPQDARQREEMREIMDAAHRAGELTRELMLANGEARA